MELVPCLQDGSQFGDFSFSHDSKYLFCCCGSVIKVYNTSNGECVRDLKAHSLKVTGVALNPSNVLQIISCGQDGLLMHWDYLDGVKLKEYNLHIPLFGIVSINSDKKSLMMIAQTSEHKKTFSLMQWKKMKPSYSEFGKPKVLIEECRDDRRLISFGCSRGIIASGMDNVVTVYSMAKESSNRLKDIDKYNKNKAVTCVACHPEEYIIACGYETGKIVLWHNVAQSNPVPSLRHWHVLPVLCLNFSMDGSILLSGGHECVLVRWQMSNAQQKDFKPRMGAPISHVLLSPDGNLFATKHSDNVVQLLNINLKILQVYRGLTRSNMGLHTNKKPIPCGLKYDPRSKALVTNGLPGHLQFYSLALHKQLFNLDIVGQNYISPENLDKPKVVTEVTCTAISDDGVWLATFEAWDDNYFSPELRLKFWMWSPEAQTYCLNTTVESPHDGSITSMTFRPMPLLTKMAPTLATIGTDKCFKLWTLIDDSNIYRSNSKWDCESVGVYRCLDAKCADFSHDASVMAVGFEHLLTLWDPDSNIVKTTLTCSPSEKQNIVDLKFGKHSCVHQLVVATGTSVVAWDLFSLTIIWSMPQEKGFLFRDPSSDLMGFVTKSRNLSVFRPSSSKIIYEHQKVSSSPVLDAIFVPEVRPTKLAKVGWPGNSQIYLFTEDEELITFDVPRREEKDASNRVKIAQNLPNPALKMLMAEKVVREANEEKDVTDSVMSSTHLEQESFMATVLHSNEPVSLHCSHYLQNLVAKRKSSQTRSSSKGRSNSEDEESSESEMEVDETPTKVLKSSAVDETPVSARKEQIKDTVLNRPPPKDWVDWCAALKLK